MLKVAGFFLEKTLVNVHVPCLVFFNLFSYTVSGFEHILFPSKVIKHFLKARWQMFSATDITVSLLHIVNSAVETQNP